MGRGIFHVGHVTKDESVSTNLEVDEFLKVIDKMPSEEITPLESLRLTLKMAKLMKKAEKL
ncbi:hypothetical protein PNA2_1004 [Pyrococcus sp. NA2]|uniref:hypothetical protein n=1 Tax=Pyrococcus sp. (strain NA2) TaxID=342949 RepID=UPI000209A9EB|nr:hypothetical protein [Pyrococcus sp. NA2]AEC51920.1 hypothetical protein PNA2_1004 [Pyrococcus sp. NA2]